MRCASPPPTAGTAVLSKIEPLSVDYALPGHPDPASVKGRIVTLEFESCYVVGTYVVNAGTGLKVRVVHWIHFVIFAIFPVFILF